MRNANLAADFVRRAGIRVRAVEVLYAAASWADVVRESQEIVELALKGLLLAAGIEPPRIHDVSDILLAEGGLEIDASREASVEILELGHSQGGVEVGQAIVPAHGIVLKRPGVGQFGGGGEMAGALGQLGALGEQSSATTGGDQLVAVEAEGAHCTEQAAMGAIAPASERFGGIFH